MLGWPEVGGGIKLLDCLEMEKQMQRRGESWRVAGDSKYSKAPSFLGHWCHVEVDWPNFIWGFLEVQM